MFLESGLTRLCYRKLRTGTDSRAIRENVVFLFTDGLTRVGRDDSTWGPSGRGLSKKTTSHKHSDSQPTQGRVGGLSPLKELRLTGELI